MNAYEVDIWCGVKRDGQWSHNVTRRELVHALNESKARQKITLAPAKTVHAACETIEVSAEFVYSIRKTGTVTIQRMYVYSDGRSPRPVVKGANHK